MPLSWNAGPQAEGMIADRDLWLDKSRDVLVDERQAASLLCGKGQAIYPDEVQRLGLVVVDGRVVQASAEAEPVAEIVEESSTEEVGHGQDEG